MSAELKRAIAQCDKMLDHLTRRRFVGTKEYNELNHARARCVCILNGKSQQGQEDEVARVGELIEEGRVAGLRAAQDCAKVAKAIEAETREKQERAQRVLLWIELGAAFLAGFTGVRRL